MGIFANRIRLADLGGGVEPFAMSIIEKNRGDRKEDGHNFLQTLKLYFLCLESLRGYVCMGLSLTVSDLFVELLLNPWCLLY